MNIQQHIFYGEEHEVIGVIGESTKEVFIDICDYDTQVWASINCDISARLLAWTDVPDREDKDWVSCDDKMPEPTDKSGWNIDEPDYILLHGEYSIKLGWYGFDGWYVKETDPKDNEYIDFVKQDVWIKEGRPIEIYPSEWERYCSISKWMPCPKIKDFWRKNKGE